MAVGRMLNWAVEQEIRDGVPLIAVLGAVAANRSNWSRFIPGGSDGSGGSYFSDEWTRLVSIVDGDLSGHLVGGTIAPSLKIIESGTEGKTSTAGVLPVPGDPDWCKRPIMVIDERTLEYTRTPGSPCPEFVGNVTLTNISGDVLTSAPWSNGPAIGWTISYEGPHPDFGSFYGVTVTLNNPLFVPCEVCLPLTWNLEVWYSFPMERLRVNTMQY